MIYPAIGKRDNILFFLYQFVSVFFKLPATPATKKVARKFSTVIVQKFVEILDEKSSIALIFNKMW